MPASYSRSGSRILFSLLHRDGDVDLGHAGHREDSSSTSISQAQHRHRHPLAGVVDDTGAGSCCPHRGAATRGAVNVHDLGLTLGLLLAFIGAMVFVVYPILRALMRVTARASGCRL